MQKRKRSGPPARSQLSAAVQGAMDDPLKRDFRNFVYVLWQHLGLPAPTGIQYDISRFLQNGPRRRMIKAFRGVGKSWLTAAFVLWRLYRNAEERILVVSASKERADSFSVFVRRLIDEVPMLQYLRPREGQRDSVISFDVGPASAHQAPSVKSVGITGQMAGSRASVIVADDVEIPKNSLTQTMRDKLAELVKEFDAVLTPDGEVIYLGTDQTEMSLYSKLPERGYVVRIWPARYPNKKQRELYGNTLAPFITKKLEEDPGLALQCNGRGAPTEPSRFSDVDLLEREASYARSGFAMQFMLLPQLGDNERHPLKLADIMVMDLDPELGPVKLGWGSGPQQIINDLPSVGLTGDRWHRPMFIPTEAHEFQKFTGMVMAIDPAGRGGDELAYAIVGHLSGFLFVFRVRGLKGGFADENLDIIAKEAKKYGVKHIIVEENFGDGMFSKLLQPHLQRIYPCSTEEVKHSIQKERRICDTLEPVMNQHRLVIDRRLVSEDMENYNEYPGETFHRYQLFHQMTRITRDRGALTKDDRLDVLAMAVAYWVESMSKDVEQNLKLAREKALDIELKRFMGSVLGRAPSSDQWNPSGIQGSRR